MSAAEQKQLLLLKGLVIQALSLLVNTALEAEVGEKLFNKKVEIVSQDEGVTVVNVSFGTRTKKELTIRDISTP